MESQTINGISNLALCLKVKDNFGVTSNGTLYANEANITGEITATKLTLRNIQIPTSDISGLSNVATSGSYTDLSGTPDLSVYATNDSLTDYVLDSDLSNTLAGYATTGLLNDYLKTNDLNTKLDALKVAYRGDV